MRVAVTMIRIAVGWRRSVRQVATMTRASDLCVIEDEHPEAFVVPGLRGGRIVVTSAMLGALPAAERRALFAHERCHLRHRHHLYACAVAVATAADPLLSRWPAALRSALERWADESAAEVAGRGTTATGLARAALARQRPRRSRSRAITALASPDPAIGFGAADHQVVERIRSLQRGPTPARPLLTLLAATLALACTTVVTAAAISANDRVQTAESRYAATSPVHR